MRFPVPSKIVVALAALSCLAAAQARAQDFPSRVVRVVVAFPAGGPTDFVARLLAERLKPLLGQNVIVENRAGANGSIGADYVAKGEADGHLLFLTTVGADVATLAEQGFPDTVADNWYGLLAPAKMPPAVVAKVHDAVVAVLEAPDVRETLLQSGAVPAPTSSAEFGKILSEELARWGRVVREKNIKED